MPSTTGVVSVERRVDQNALDVHFGTPWESSTLYVDWDLEEDGTGVEWTMLNRFGLGWGGVGWGGRDWEGPIRVSREMFFGNPTRLALKLLRAYGIREEVLSCLS